MELKGEKQLSQKIRDKFGAEQDETTEALQQSGDFASHSLNNIMGFAMTANALFGGGGGAHGSTMQAVFNGDSPDHYTESFKLLKKYIDQSLDQYKEDLMNVLFPIFSHLFLNMIQAQYYEQAKHFFNEEKGQFMMKQSEELNILEQVDSVAKLSIPEVQNFLNNKFLVKMSVYASQLLMHYVKLNQFILIMQILNQNVTFQLSGEKTIVDLNGLTSYLISDSVQEINKTELLLGKLPHFSPEYAIQNQQMPASVSDPNQATPANQSQQNASQQAADQLQQKVTIITSHLKSIQKLKKQVQNIMTEPSTLIPSRLLTAITLSQSGNLMACGYQDSMIKVFILDSEQYEAVTIQDVRMEQFEKQNGLQNPNNPGINIQLAQRRKMVNPQTQTLNIKDLRSDMEEKKSQKEYVLYGHSGPVYGLTILLDDKSMLSCSFDTSRYYFASCSNDRTAKLWQIKQHVPIRIFVGHLSDVEAIEFHPNVHYLATGSSDKQIRLWSCLSGECVRILLTIPGTVRSLKFSKSGNHLISGNEYGQLVIFDINKAVPLEIIQTCQTKAIWSIDVSWDDQMIAIGTEDATIELYSLNKILSQQGKSEYQGQVQRIPGKSSSTSFIKSFKTKTNGILLTQFTWRNFLYTAGCFEKKSNLLKILEIILAQQDKIKIVSDLAFDAVDLDGSGFLEKNELAEVMKNVAYEMKVKPPTDGDIDAVLRELDEDYDEKVSKDEFVQLIIQVMRKMLESEEDLQKQINSQVKK
ncbi:transcription initiation factor tfiid subunit 5-like [Stylonychia lemnae]|uniref:Transcription initiation factor tfiid subunit 5-like n=1 Tax=Stylonychia lemnae TaxID=5949 RepID=A0A078B4Q8_STYLE|nr:transcription initiation factor tfiid subunit 5-like [Stylonychia lemnae]|eukprot:CDW89409.1 transcription initiation factor tfiid subunit 5-like [Stylonychia lemnae]